VNARPRRIGATDPYSASRYPHARDADEETYYRRVHYLATFMYEFGAATDVLDALLDICGRTIGSLPEPGRTTDHRQAD